MNIHVTDALSKTLELAAPVMFLALAAIMLTAVYSSI